MAERGETGPLHFARLPAPNRNSCPEIGGSLGATTSSFLSSSPAPPSPSEAELRSQLVSAVGSAVDLLPLPDLPSPPQPLGRGSRTRQRHHRAMAVWRVASRALAAINALGTNQPLHGEGVQVPQPQRIRAARVTSATEKAWLHILREGQRTERARRVSTSSTPTGAALLERVIKRGGPVDGYDSDRSTYVPFLAERIVEPILGHSIVRLKEALPEEVFDCYSDTVGFFLPTDEMHGAEFQQLCRRYDQIVLSGQDEWVRYLCREDVRQLWELAPSSQAIATMSVAPF